MTENNHGCYASHRMQLHMLFQRFNALKKPFLLRSELQEEFQSFCETDDGKDLAASDFAEFFEHCHEAAIRDPWFYLANRPRIGEWHFWRFHMDEMLCREIGESEYLKFKEKLADGVDTQDDWTLEVDLKPFNREFPRMKEARSIGQGVEFLNRHLSTRIFKDLGEGHTKLFDFLKVHQVGGEQLMINQQIDTVEKLQEALRRADALLEKKAADTEWSVLCGEMQRLGFEPGWGRNAGRVLETIRMLQDILEAPDPGNLRRFLSRIPMIFNLVIVTPHGYFGQTGVLGLPDTGGQVVYILDQVRSLEQELQNQMHEYGLRVEPRIIVLTRLIPDAGDTTCDQETEAVMGTKNARILRVPFRSENGEVIRQWISRFEIYPHLEGFAREAERRIIAELGRKPDLIIGNYTDGNLVAYLLAQHLKVTQCNIAHALEKTKYLYSDLYWRELEEIHHFSCQFTADLIAMNTADFIVTSTYHEIAGDEENIGQYESYTNYTMPGLYRVKNGIDVYDPKFNIVSPGPSQEVFFPYYETQKRYKDVQDAIQNLVFSNDGNTGRGEWRDPDKPVILSLARLDIIKNITGLVEWFGKSPELRDTANLLISAGFVDASRSASQEEREQIAKLHGLMDEFELDGHVRWIEMQTKKTIVSELYRFAADRRGVFVQPALFEAFGLTVVEAMISGLPTFATCYGGPREIIEHGESGFHVNPNHGDRAAADLVAFFNRCKSESDYWETISNNGIKRVRERYNWTLYAGRLLSLAKIYGFWKYVSDLEREETGRYLQMFYGLMFRRRAKTV